METNGLSSLKNFLVGLTTPLKIIFTPPFVEAWEESVNLWDLRIAQLKWGKLNLLHYRKYFPWVSPKQVRDQQIFNSNKKFMNKIVNK